MKSECCFRLELGYFLTLGGASVTVDAIFKPLSYLKTHCDSTYCYVELSFKLSFRRVLRYERVYNSTQLTASSFDLVSRS